jgi:arginine exporter protein ArgO
MLDLNNMSDFAYLIGCIVSSISWVIFIGLMIHSFGGIKAVIKDTSWKKILLMIGATLIIFATSWFSAIVVIVGIVSKEWKKYNYFKKDKN